MIIAYLLDFDIVEEFSVFRKIENQIEFWEKSNHTVYLIIVSHNTKKQYAPKVKNLIIVERPRVAYLFNKELKVFFGRNAAFKIVYDLLKKLKPSVIYHRPGNKWYPYLSACLNLYPTILELNSIDEEEIKLYYPESGIKFKLFNYGRKKIIRESMGLVAVTNEISTHYNTYNKDSIVIANGFNTNNISNHKSERLQYTDRPQVIFIGSASQSWQGFEKLYFMAEKIPNADFHIIGIDHSELDLPIPANLTLHGYLPMTEVQKIYMFADIGIGTLNLYEKKMKEACPLKVREYIAHGLPIIIGYVDTDIKDSDRVLEIGCHKSNVDDNIDSIKNFIFINQKRFFTKKEGTDLIGIRNKERRRVAFLQSIFNKTT